jgi:hypothetical protein
MNRVQIQEAVRTTPLTAADLAAYRDRGYVIAGRLLSDAQVSTSRARPFTNIWSGS